MKTLTRTLTLLLFVLLVTTALVHTQSISADAVGITGQTSLPDGAVICAQLGNGTPTCTEVVDNGNGGTYKIPGLGNGKYTVYTQFCDAIQWQTYVWSPHKSRLDLWWPQLDPNPC